MSRFNGFLRLISRFRTFCWLLLLLISCTIIEDMDITSKAELDNLKLKYIEIVQETNSGNTTSVAKVTTDSVVNIAVSGSTINRTLWMDWPALGNSKLKLKSGVTTSFKSYTSYIESGKPWTFYLFDKDSVLSELYRFRYDANGRLNRIITNVPFVENGPATSNDTIIYDTGGKLSSIIRRSSDLSKTGTFTFEFNSGSFNTGKVFKSTFQGRYFQNYSENSYYTGVDGQGGGVNNDGNLNLINIQKQSLSMIDRNNVDGNCQCKKWIDTFYFHPLMLVKDQLELGDELLFIYMVDWWQPISTQETTTDQKVTFSFKYAL